MPVPHDDLVSVVMPVHNALPHLDDAILSILGQSHRNFEFVILDDASTDGSTERLRDWAAKDDRIRLHRGEANVGPAASSNRVVHLSKTPLIARMDAGDVSHPDRLRRQIQLLNERSDIGLVGTLCDIIDGEGRRVRGPDLWRLAKPTWFAPFPHGSIMYRRELFDLVGGYRAECVFWEDQDLFIRMASEARLVTIPSALYRHRHSRISTRLMSDPGRVERAVDLMYRSIGRLDQCRDYDGLLRGEGSRADRGLDPRVFISLGSLILWAGRRPKLFGRLLKHAELKANFRTLTALAWTAWAAVSPASLRLFMKMLARLRNAASGSVALDDPAVEWRLPRPRRSLINSGQPKAPADSEPRIQGRARL